MLRLFEIKHDNMLKLYDYKEAKNTVNVILSNYQDLLSEKEKSDMENFLKIWTALEHEPKQSIIINETSYIKVEKDKAGLDNLKVFVESDTLDFVFDTGANLSTISKTAAVKLKMKIIPVDIEVGTITGLKVTAQLAVCPLLKLNNIEIRHVVFLVLEDKDLSVPQINYQIYGILGFPVLEALREIQITQDGYFIIPQKETVITAESNMAMDGLTPLICIDGRHYTFDTGAGNTILYYSYYLANQNEIDKNYKPTKISFSGAGGKKEYDGYIITTAFNVIGKEITLKDIQLLNQKIKEDESVFGNIGQDLIKQSNKMTLNFKQMFIKFDY
jgi:predicted aspartyl protease